MGERGDRSGNGIESGWYVYGLNAEMRRCPILWGSDRVGECSIGDQI